MDGLQELLNSVQTSLANRISFINDYFCNIKATIVLGYLFYSTRLITNFNKKYNYIYNSSKIARVLINNISYFFNYSYSYLINKKIEPMQTNWVSSYVLSKTIESPKYLDNNKFLEEDYFLLESYEYDVQNSDFSFFGDFL